MALVCGMNNTLSNIFAHLTHTGAGRTIIEGANIHIFVFTDCKNNRFQKKVRVQGMKNMATQFKFCICACRIAHVTGIISASQLHFLANKNA